MGRHLSSIERFVERFVDPEERPKRNPVTYAETVFNSVMNQWHLRRQRDPDYAPRRLVVGRAVWHNMLELFPKVCQQRVLRSFVGQVSGVETTVVSETFSGVPVCVRGDGWCLE